MPRSAATSRIAPRTSDSEAPGRPSSPRLASRAKTPAAVPRAPGPPAGWSSARPAPISRRQWEQRCGPAGPAVVRVLVRPAAGNAGSRPASARQLPTLIPRQTDTRGASPPDVPPRLCREVRPANPPVRGLPGALRLTHGQGRSQGWAGALLRRRSLALLGLLLGLCLGSRFCSGVGAALIGARASSRTGSAPAAPAGPVGLCPGPRTGSRSRCPRRCCPCCGLRRTGSCRRWSCPPIRRRSARAR